MPLCGRQAVPHLSLVRSSMSKTSAPLRHVDISITHSSPGSPTTCWPPTMHPHALKFPNPRCGRTAQVPFQPSGRPTSFHKGIALIKVVWWLILDHMISFMTKYFTWISALGGFWDNELKPSIWLSVFSMSIKAYCAVNLCSRDWSLAYSCYWLWLSRAESFRYIMLRLSFWMRQGWKTKKKQAKKIDKTRHIILVSP